MDDMPSLHTLSTALRTFTSSAQRFQILQSFPSRAPNPVFNQPKTLYILDSSFNPPTLAHLRICTTALLHDSKARSAGGQKRLLLLLATQNADKPPKPAAFDQRLQMMCLFARDVLRCVNPKKMSGSIGVDIAVTKLPIFVDKVEEIEKSGVYGDPGEVEQVHLIGFDTLVRLLDTKYYPPRHTLEPLEKLFGSHRVRVTKRTGDNWGGVLEQDRYVRKLVDGEREEEGWKKQWVEKTELVEGRQADEEVISSTKVREAVKAGDRSMLEKAVSQEVAKWIFDEGLYKEDE